MTKTQRFTKRLKRFASNQQGSIAVMYALAAVPVMLAAGAAIDFVRFNAVQTHVQAALDAGTLAAAAGQGVTDTQRIASGSDIFNANLSKGPAAGYDSKVSFTVDNGKVVASASVIMPTTLMSIAGITQMIAGGEAEVGIGVDKKAEIAMVLDYSGSMEEVVGGQVKYVAMRDAAKKLVDDLSKANPTKVKFGLVPFSHHVYTSLPNAYVLGKTGAGTWTGCTQDRKYPYNISDSTPTTDNASKWGQPMAPDHAAYGCSGYVQHNLRTVPLTTDFKAVNSQLDAMTPYAWTHIAVGVEFGYHLLSPNAPYGEGVAYTDKGTRKFMVVLTDGMQTEPAFGPGNIRSVAQGESNLEKLCTSAKANGITIITMALDLDDTTTRKRLQNCASDPVKNFFVLNGSADIASAFEAVKSEVSAQVFLSK